VKGLSDADFAVTREFLLATAGLVFDESRRAGLSAVLADRLRVTGAGSVPAYLEILDGDGGELERQRLLDGVTVQETHFAHATPRRWRRCAAGYCPSCSGAPPGDRPLTIWSRLLDRREPYTLAMLLLELSPMLARRQGPIVATDVSAEALRAARRPPTPGAPSSRRRRWCGTAGSSRGRRCTRGEGAGDPAGQAAAAQPGHRAAAVRAGRRST
jgi:chemotaxis methyl-accepting protein methylase